MTSPVTSTRQVTLAWPWTAGCIENGMTLAAAESAFLAWSARCRNAGATDDTKVGLLGYVDSTPGLLAIWEEPESRRRTEECDCCTTEAAVGWAEKELAPDITVVTEAPASTRAADRTPPLKVRAVAAIRDMTEHAHLRAIHDVIEDAYERGRVHALDDVYRTLARVDH